MVIAPHPDDEVIGCGGLIRRQHRDGCGVTVLYLTCASEERRQEARAAHALLGVVQVRELGLSEGAGVCPETAIAAVVGVLDKERPHAVFAPGLEDVHPDHQGGHRLLAAALRRWATESWLRDLPWVFTYEGFSPQPKPNRWLDITDIAEDKWAALDCFRSQDRLYRLREIIGALNRFRGLSTFRRRVEYAEAFTAIDAKSYVTAVEARFS